MKRIRAPEITIEAEGFAEKISGKRFFTISSEDRSSDIFIEAENVRADLRIAVFFGWVFLFNRKRTNLKATGFTIFHRVYLAPREIRIHINGIPIMISSTHSRYPPPTKNAAVWGLLAASTICFFISACLWFIPLPPESEKSFQHRPTFPMKKAQTEKRKPVEELNYFYLKDILMDLENTGNMELEKAIEALSLAKKIYEKKGIDEWAGVTGRTIGGINRHLFEQREITLKTGAKTEREDNS